MNIEIVTADTLREAIKILLKKKLRPLTIEEVWKLRKHEKIPSNWYDTGTLWYQGKFQQVTKKQLEDIQSIYEDDGRLVCLGVIGYDGLYGNYILDSDGRFAAVPWEDKDGKRNKSKK